MRYLSSVYFVSQPVRVSGIFVAHQEVHCIYTISQAVQQTVNRKAQHAPVFVYI
jgi:hypothetical protein